LVDRFVLGMPRRRTNNFPESGRGLGHVTTTIFGSTVGYPSDIFASCLLYYAVNVWWLSLLASHQHLWKC